MFQFSFYFILLLLLFIYFFLNFRSVFVSISFMLNTGKEICISCCGLDGLVVSALDFQAGYRRFESCSGRDNFQTISTPTSYSTYPGLSIKWTGWRLVTDSGTKCAWMIHESKAVQIHVHNNRRCFYVPRVSGSVKNLHNNNNAFLVLISLLYLLL